MNPTERFLVLSTAIAAFLLLRYFLRLRKRRAGFDDWQNGWKERFTALERAFGAADEGVLTAMPPFYWGGGADVLTFRGYVDGVAYVTAALIGDETALPNELGQYELMICLRQEAEWAPRLISQLARYTTEAVLAPRDTMDIGASLPPPSKLSSFLFTPTARLTVDGRPAAVMLCLGITADEVELCREKGADELIARLKRAGVYPFTDLTRDSALMGRGN